MPKLVEVSKSDFALMTVAIENFVNEILPVGAIISYLIRSKQQLGFMLILAPAGETLPGGNRRETPRRSGMELA
jgi:hypothetical protein